MFLLKMCNVTEVESLHFLRKKNLNGKKVNSNFSSNYEMKAVIVERVIRTLKRMIGGGGCLVFMVRTLEGIHNFWI